MVIKNNCVKLFIPINSALKNSVKLFKKTNIEAKHNNHFKLGYLSGYPNLPAILGIIRNNIVETATLTTILNNTEATRQFAFSLSSEHLEIKTFADVLIPNHPT